LVKQTWLCKKAGRNVALKLIAGAPARNGIKRARFEVVEAVTPAGLGFDPSGFSKAGNASCPFCGSVTDSAYVKDEGVAGRIGHQLMAVACSRPSERGKGYVSGDDIPNLVPDEQAIRQRIEALCQRSGLTIPQEPIINDAKGALFCVMYGLRKWGDIFSPRQLLCLLTFAAAIRQAEADMAFYEDDRRCAVVVLLAAMLDRLADFSSTICVWNCLEGERTAHTFGRQSLPMTWDYSETAPFNEENAGWPIALERIIPAIESVDFSDSAQVARGSALSLPYPGASLDAIVTDPPYYDNVPYADISDFFYIWLGTVSH
jgi:putative DNA methylase